LYGDPTLQNKLAAWITVARLPFHLVGILPFILGTVLAWEIDHSFHIGAFIIGVTAVVLTMLSTYLAGEYWDFEEDSISQRIGRTMFSGGTGVLQTGLIDQMNVLKASQVALIIAGTIFLIIPVLFPSRALILILGVLGLMGGFFYSTPPIRWIKRGLGELWIAFCYGWLTVATGYYLQTGRIPILLVWISAPIALTIFNVILLNEFPDHLADSEAGKTNLLVRLGMENGSILYVIISVIGWFTVLYSTTRINPQKTLLAYSPVFIISVYLVIEMLNKKWRYKENIERLCAANLLVNLGTTACFILAYIG
jgi:1,4-dihydroxy-2-naphthoate octaprenyltransferase